MPRYNPAVIEPKWQNYWDVNKTFATPDLPVGEKLYVLDMFPYPSGNGLHVGHPEGYTATDITCRFERMRGKSVLHPMGYDAFGLPAEEHAIRTNTPPRESTENNIKTFTRQLKMLGFSYDWDRSFATTDVEYFKWTQWIFLQLFDTWYDSEQQQGRPISELPIPQDVVAAGEREVRLYQDDHRLAYQADALVNWCPELGTVLANEEVIDGRSERGSHPVHRIPLRQWTLRITAYADRLENDLEHVDWPSGIKKLQADWIGRSTGAEVDFLIGPADGVAQWKAARLAGGFPRKPDNDVLRIYTTRPDTLFGATYMVIAPEHPLVERLTTDDCREAVDNYCHQASLRSDRDRTEDTSTKTGVFTGGFAVNPINDELVPVWVADYVLISYGTGAIMAVPAHDQRDFEFAKTYDIPVVAVVDPGADSEDRDEVLAGNVCSIVQGRAIHSGEYDGLETAVFKEKIQSVLTEQGWGRAAVNYKLRDWLFSRQRFWGEPFPILHELGDDGEPNGLIRSVDIADLPVDLPYLEDYKPHGRPEPPLGKADDDWLYCEIDGKRYRREINTMPQWAGSCWYFLRFIDSKNGEIFVDPEKEKAWMPVDLYIGGAEHAVLHLLYARFWHKVLFDRGHVSTPEPFQRLVNQGMILGEMEYSVFQDSDENWVSFAAAVRSDTGDYQHRENGNELRKIQLDEQQVTRKGDSWVLVEDEHIGVDGRCFKMSKSRGNVVNPDVIVSDYGADSLRLYEMFMGPLVATKPWNMSGVNGVRGFLDRVWRMIVDDRADNLAVNAALSDEAPTAEQLKMLHQTIHSVSVDTENLDFNTAIARMMEFVNFFTGQSSRPQSIMQSFLLLLSPYAPHIAEELWELLGNDKTLAYEPWPVCDESLLVENTIEVPVQIRGKVKTRISVAADINQTDLEQAAREDERVAELLSGAEIIKVIVVPGRLVNFVTK
ncbi:MAG: leucine--tRNA ligase [Planctomycetaceae bacterium]|nr:leucine--tRNA ligase [Planctomycetaceae bacterium]